MNDHAKSPLITPRRALTSGELGQLCDSARLKLLSLSRAMRWIDEQGKPAERAYREMFASGKLAPLSQASIKRWHLQWVRLGEYGVIDHRECGGCGIGECGNKHRSSLLRKATVNYWVELATKIKVHSGKAHGKSVTYKEAWKQLIGALCRGELIPGLTNEATPGTWQQIWASVYPHRAMPTGNICPWSVSRVPPGFSYQNFLLRKPEKAIMVTAQQGVGAGRQLIPEVNLDVSKLLPMQWLQFDDKRIDVRLLVMVDGKPQFVEAWCLFAIDVSTRMIVGFRLIPRITRKDGSQRGISRRDVAHLAADILRFHGYPTAYKSKWTGENASAAFTDELIEIISRATFGQVQVKTSGTFAEKATISGYIERGGNPQGKAYIERFNKTIDTLAGALPGQMGANYTRKSGDSDAMLLQDVKTAKALAHLVTPDELTAVTRHLTEEQFLPLLLQALHDYNNDPLHNLQGFQQVTHWRHGLGGEWMSLEGPELAEMMSLHGAEFVNRYLDHAERIETRMETRAERWQKLYNPANFARVDDVTYADLRTDAASAKYDVFGCLRCSFKPLSGRKFDLEFRGQIPALEMGKSYRVRFDFDRLEMGCSVQSEHGQFLGSMRYVARTDARDEAALKEALGESQHQRAELLKRTRKVVERRETIVGEIFRTENENAFISSLLPNGRIVEAATAPSSRELQDAKNRAAMAVQEPKFDALKEQMKSLEAAEKRRESETQLEPDFDGSEGLAFEPETDALAMASDLTPEQLEELADEL